MGAMTDAPLIAEWSRPEQERPGTHLVVMFHGYSSHEKDLMGLVPALPQEGFTYVGLRAPREAGPGFAWFALDQQLGYDPREAEQATDQAVAWIEEVREDFADVSLLGFSQGMAMATSVARRRPDLVRALVGLSGMVVSDEGEYFRDQELAARSPRLPVFYGRGQEDTVIPEALQNLTLDWLREHTELTKVVYAGLGHGVGQQEATHAKEFLQHVLR